MVSGSEYIAKVTVTDKQRYMIMFANIENSMQSLITTYEGVSRSQIMFTLLTNGCKWLQTVVHGRK